MIFIPLLLASALDMSLPEFQPLEDENGNYIVASYDVSENEVVVEEVPAGEVVIEEQEEFIEEEEPAAEASPSRSAEGSRSAYLTTTQIKMDLNENLTIIRTGYYASTMYKYVTLEAGKYYSISSDASVIYIGSNKTTNTQLSVFTGSSYEASSTMYLFVLDNYSLNVMETEAPTPDPSGNDPTPDPSGNNPSDPSGNDPSVPSDPTEIVESLNHISIQIKALLFVSLMGFLYPIAMNCLKLIGGRKDV